MAGVRVGAMVEGAGQAEHVRSRQDGSFEAFLLPADHELPESTLNLFVQGKTGELESELVGPLALTRDGVDGLVVRVARARRSEISGVVIESPVAKCWRESACGSPAGSPTIWSGAERRRRLGGNLPHLELAAGSYGILLIARRRQHVQPRRRGSRESTWRKEESLIGLRLVFGEDKGGLTITGRCDRHVGKSDRAGRDHGGWQGRARASPVGRGRALSDHRADRGQLLSERASS